MENIWHSISHKKLQVVHLLPSQICLLHNVTPPAKFSRGLAWEEITFGNNGRGKSWDLPLKHARLQCYKFCIAYSWNDESDFESINQKILSTKYALKNTAPKHSSKGDEFYRFLPMRKSGRRNVARSFQTITVIFSF